MGYKATQGLERRSKEETGRTLAIPKSGGIMSGVKHSGIRPAIDSRAAVLHVAARCGLGVAREPLQDRYILFGVRVMHRQWCSGLWGRSRPTSFIASTASPVSRLAWANETLPSTHGATKTVPIVPLSLNERIDDRARYVSWLRTMMSSPNGPNGLLALGIKVPQSQTEIELGPSLPWLALWKPRMQQPASTDRTQSRSRSR